MAAFLLQSVLDLAERRAEGRVRLVRMAHGEWLLARARLVRLEGELERYRQAFQQAAGGVGDGGLWREGAVHLQELGRRRAEGRGAVEQRHALWQTALQDWREEKRRVDALRVLKERHERQEVRRRGRQEAKLHDELAARAAQLRAMVEGSQGGSA